MCFKHRVHIACEASNLRRSVTLQRTVPYGVHPVASSFSKESIKGERNRPYGEGKPHGLMNCALKF